jgi:cell division protease FtsH
MLFQELLDVRKVTIQSNLNGAGGYTLFTPKDQYSNFPTKKFILANMIVAMGGRAAEVYSFKSSNNETYLNYNNEAVFSDFKDLDITTGASNDLKQVNSLARRFVSLYGLGTNIGLYDSSDPSQPFLGRELATNQNKISEYTKQQIELEVEKLVKFSFDTALKIIESNEVEYKHISNLLLQKRTITQEDLIPIRITMC